MEIDNIHQLARNLKYPENLKQGFEYNLHEIEQYLQEINLQEKKKMQRISILFFAGALFFLFIILFSRGQGENYVRQWGLILLFLVYLSIAALALVGRRQLMDTDYSLPVLERLKKLEKRFLFFNPRIWYIYPLFIMLDISCCLLLLGNSYIPYEWGIGWRIGLAQLIFLFILAIGFFFGYKDWKKYRKEQYEKIRKIIRELTSE
jgi:hypothetical protein